MHSQARLPSPKAHRSRASCPIRRRSGEAGRRLGGDARAPAAFVDGVEQLPVGCGVGVFQLDPRLHVQTRPEQRADAALDDKHEIAAVAAACRSRAVLGGHTVQASHRAGCEQN